MKVPFADFVRDTKRRLHKPRKFKDTQQPFYLLKSWVKH